MARPLTERERRGAALIALALVLIGLYWVLVQSWFAGPLSDVNSQIEQLREQQQRYAGQLAQRPLLEQQLSEAQDDPASSTSLLPGSDPSAVAADLMQRIADLIKAKGTQGAGCALTQRMPITPEQDSAQPYRQIKVSLTLECGIEPLMTLLHTLEFHRPFLFVDSLSVRRGNSAPATGGAGRLTVHLLVRGYLAKPGQEAP